MRFKELTRVLTMPLVIVLTRVLSVLLIIVLITANTRINDVLAYYAVEVSNTDNGTVENQISKDKTAIMITFHYSDNSTWSEPLTPQIDGKRNIAIYDDEVAYIKEYTLPHRDDNPIVSVSITYPKVTHSADDDSDHVRMYWAGTYAGTIKGIYDGWHTELQDGTSGAYGVWNVKPGADG